MIDQSGDTPLDRTGRTADGHLTRFLAVATTSLQVRRLQHASHDSRLQGACRTTVGVCMLGGIAFFALFRDDSNEPAIEVEDVAQPLPAMP